jgi:cytosine/adenosine deaminase-related metal-dependent hydrolase
VPVDGAPIAGGYVSVAEGRIAAIGAADPHFGPVEDLGDILLMPGLVNAHTHLEFSTIERPLGEPGIGLPAWIRLVIGERNRRDRDPQAATAAGLLESLASGVTTIGDIATLPSASHASSDLRPQTLAFQEAIGFSAGRVESVFADVQRRLDEAQAPAGLSPHAPYTVHPRLLERIVQLAAARGAPVAMHLAESREELELLEIGGGPFRKLLEERSMWDAGAIPPGTRPLDYLRRLAEAPRSLVIHGNYLSQSEIEFIAQHRQWMSVVYCPRTHAYFGHEPYPLDAMRAAGVRVALGTDSRASNPDLSVLGELRHVAMTFPNIASAEILRMATMDGAEALGLDGEMGSLVVGKRGDLLAIPCDPTDSDPYTALFGSTSEHCRVWIGGREVPHGAPSRSSGPLPSMGEG